MILVTPVRPDGSYFILFDTSRLDVPVPDGVARDIAVCRWMTTEVGVAAIPLWVLMVGAIGISLGLALYGPRLIKTVGTGITELDQMRAFCIAMAASITVILASQLGLAVSSTHIAVGAVFGVGFFREFYTRRSRKRHPG